MGCSEVEVRTGTLGQGSRLCPRCIALTAPNGFDLGPRAYSAAMSTYFEVHPDNPQPRTVAQVVAMLRDDALIAYPTDSGYALGCRVGNGAGVDRIKRLRELDAKHHFTLVCHDFAQLGEYVRVSNPMFRLISACTPGPYTFILPATREVPRKLLHPKKRTVGVRIPDSAVAQALLAELGEPMMSSTLILPGEEEALAEGEDVREAVGGGVDAILDAGHCGVEPTTVVDFSDGQAEVVRIGAGDAGRF